MNSRARRAKLWKNLKAKFLQQDWAAGPKMSLTLAEKKMHPMHPIHPMYRTPFSEDMDFLMSSSKLNGLSHPGWNVFALVTTFVLVALHVFMSTSQLVLWFRTSPKLSYQFEKKSQFSMRCTENHQQCLPQLFFKQLSLINCETTPSNASRLSKSIEAIRYKI